MFFQDLWFFIVLGIWFVGLGICYKIYLLVYLMVIFDYVELWIKY